MAGRSGTHFGNTICRFDGIALRDLGNIDVDVLCERQDGADDMRPMPAPINVSRAANPTSTFLDAAFVVKFRMFNVDPGVQYSHLEVVTCTCNVCVDKILESIDPFICLSAAGTKGQPLTTAKGAGSKEPI